MDIFNLQRSILDFAYLGGFWIVLPVIVTAAWLWGGRAERIVSALYIAALAVSKLLKSDVAVDFHSIETGVLVADFMLVVSLAIVASRYGKQWIIFAASFQLISTLAHFARLIRSDLTPLAYSLMESASSYPALIALATGIYQHHQFVKRGVAERS